MAASEVGNSRGNSSTAGAVSAVSDAVAKVGFATETGRVRMAATKLRVLANHVVHTRLL